MSEKSKEIEDILHCINELADNAMLKQRPELFYEWDFKKNIENIWEMTRGSTKISWWICPNCKSRYDMSISERARMGNCPYCKGSRVNETNSLESIYPESLIEWDYEKNSDFSPSEVTKGSGRKVWWICKECKSSHDVKISVKTTESKCPYCTNRRVNHTNSLLALFPLVAQEWHPTKNESLVPSKVASRSKRIVWWVCRDCKSDYKCPVYYQTRNSTKTCPYCSNRMVNDTNSLSCQRPEIAREWIYEKNLPLTTHSVSIGGGKKAWWRCPDCRSVYDMFVKLRCLDDQNCPYCSGHRVNNTNSLAALRPDIASEWHPSRNEELKPSEVTSSSSKRVWWLGGCGHEWKTSIGNRAKGKACPFCSGSKVLKGFNDMWTTLPLQAELLKNKEDGYHLMRGSNKKVDWICYCGNIVKNRAPARVYTYGLCCPLCSDGKSYPEKFVGNLLMLHYDKEWIPEHTFSWLLNRRYDFYLPHHNIIIEVHGEQHYRESYSFKTPFHEIQRNDRMKKEAAIENGVNYIIIDARQSTMEHLKKSIQSSSLFCILEDTEIIDWTHLHIRANKSLRVSCSELWSEGYDISEISNMLKLSENTIRNYIRDSF